MTDIITRLRALADMHYPAKLTVVLREAADALEAEETRRMMLNTSNGEWSKRFHALEQERDGLRQRVKKLEAVAEAARVMMDASRPPGEETAKSDMRAVAEALAALEEEK